MKKKICLFVILALMLPVFLVTAPMKAEAAEENGYNMHFSRRYTHPSGASGLYFIDNYDIHVTNPDAQVFIVSFYDDVNNNSELMAFSIGASTDIVLNHEHIDQYSSYTNSDSLTLSLADLNNYDLLSNPLNKVKTQNTGGVLIAELGLNGGYTYPEYYDVNGTLCNQPQDLGYLTLGGLKLIADNLEDYRVQPEEYDESLDIPVFSHFKDNTREYLSVTNPSGNKIEMKVKIYGPASIYIESISSGLFNKKGLDMYEFAVTSDIGSNYVLADGFSDSCDFYMWGLENSPITEGENYVFLAGMFSDFTASCASNCTFEYKDYFTELQDLNNKMLWHGFLSVANSDLYEYEIYARFYDDSGSSKRYGAWQHLVLERGGNFKQSSNDDGIVDIPDDEEDNREDGDLKPVVPDVPNYDFEDFDASNLWEFLQQLVYGMGTVPNIFASVFSFLPSWVPWMIGLGIGALVLLRFLGR